MTRNSMGQFMAALRKANGMTQQEVANRLSVSNKAVSRWERDECAPDITLIPAIAEMYGVTCDELLRGGTYLPEPCGADTGRRWYGKGSCGKRKNGQESGTATKSADRPCFVRF